ncbi:ROK family protein, partial [Streptomyces olivaceoviridis]
GASGGTGEIGFLPVPGTATLPSATDCAGGFHSLTGAAAVTSLATECGLPAPAAPDGPGAAEAVRGAVAEVEKAEEGVLVPVPVVGERVPVAVPVTGPGVGVPVARPGEVDARPGEGEGRRPGGADVEAGAEPDAVTASASGEAGPGAGRSDVEPDGGFAFAPREAGPAEWASGADPGRASASVPVPVPVPVPVSESASASAGHLGCGAPPQAEPGGATPAALPGDLPAARFLRILADRIAVGAASVVAVLDPGCVVLGGEVGQAGGAVLAGLVEERLRRMSPLATEVRASGLGGTAVLRGALLTARDRAQDELFAPPDRPGG